MASLKKRIFSTGSTFADQVMVNTLAQLLVCRCPPTQRSHLDEAIIRGDLLERAEDELNLMKLEFGELSDKRSLSNSGLRPLLGEIRVNKLVEYYEKYYECHDCSRRKYKKVNWKDDREKFSSPTYRQYRKRLLTNPIFSSVELEAQLHVAPLIEMISLEVDDNVKRVIELSGLFGLVLTEQEIEHEYLKYSIMGLNGSTIEQLKYTVNVTFSHHMYQHIPFMLEDNLPEAKEWYLGMSLWPRRLRVTLNKLKSKRSQFKEETLQLVYTVFQGWKKGLWPMRPDGVVKNLVKHKNALTQDGQISDDLMKSVERIFETHFLSMGKGICSAEGVKAPESRISNRATIESSVLNGGSAGALERQFFTRSIKPTSTIVTPHVLMGFVEEEILRDHNTIRWISPRPIYGPMAASRSELIDESVDYLELEHQGPLCAQPSCIIEPMKIRIITKPTVSSYVGMRRIQKDMHRYLRSHPIFDLIGSPMDEEKAKMISTWWSPDKWWTSGDYSGATDNLKGSVSKYILKKIIERSYLKHHDPHLYERCLQSFTESEIILKKNSIPDYSEIANQVSDLLEVLRKELGDTKYQQQNGQLMGHVLSFPILCVANYISYVVSLERWLGKKMTFEEVCSKYPVKINGDDILFCNTLEHRRVWMEVIREFGFLPSMGKNFVSQDFFQINSMLFSTRTGLSQRDSLVLNNVDYCAQYVVTECKEIKYVNFALAMSRGKSDCSRDLSIHKRTILSSDRGSSALSQDRDDGELPDELHRVSAWPQIYSEYKDRLQEPLLGRARELWLKHQSKLLSYCGVNLPVRLPGRDFEEFEDLTLWEGKHLKVPLDSDLALLKESKFDNLQTRLTRKFDLDDLKDHCLRRIRISRKENEIRLGAAQREQAWQVLVQPFLSEFALWELGEQSSTVVTSSERKRDPRTAFLD